MKMALELRTKMFTRAEDHAWREKQQTQTPKHKKRMKERSIASKFSPEYPEVLRSNETPPTIHHFCVLNPILDYSFSFRRLQHMRPILYQHGSISYFLLHLEPQSIAYWTTNTPLPYPLDQTMRAKDVKAVFRRNPDCEFASALVGAEIDCRLGSRPARRPSRPPLLFFKRFSMCLRWGRRWYFFGKWVR
jgi:hypothetical protein